MYCCFYTALLITLAFVVPGQGTKSEKKIKKQTLPVVLASTTDTNGNQHPASVGFTGQAVAKCTSATGAPGFPTSCTINGNIVNVQNSVGASQTVILTCNGTAPLRCTALVTAQ